MEVTHENAVFVGLPLRKRCLDRVDELTDAAVMKLKTNKFRDKHRVQPDNDMRTMSEVESGQTGLCPAPYVLLIQFGLLPRRRGLGVRRWVLRLLIDLRPASLAWTGRNRGWEPAVRN